MITLTAVILTVLSVCVNFAIAYPFVNTIYSIMIKQSNVHLRGAEAFGFYLHGILAYLSSFVLIFSPVLILLNKGSDGVMVLTWLFSGVMIGLLRAFHDTMKSKKKDKK